MTQKLQKHTQFLVADNYLYLDARLLNAVSNHDPDIVKFLMVMALCNTVVPVKRQGTISFSTLFFYQTCRRCIFLLY